MTFKVFQNREVWGLYGLKREEEIEWWRMLHNDELYHFREGGW
jgi:hypothetical protein